MQPALISSDHKQPAIILKTDNYTTEGFVNLGMKPKRLKTWDMRWHWLGDKEFIEKLRVYWEIVINNDADYFTERHPPIRHRQMRRQYIHTSNLVRTIPHAIILCKGFLKQVPGTQYRVTSLKTIRAEPQYITNKCHNVRRLNRPIKPIM